MKLRFLTVGLILSVLLFGVVACEQKGPAEKAGEKIDNVAEKAGEKLEDDSDKVKDKLEEVGGKVEDATDKK
jgi:hypothetical protein